MPRAGLWPLLLLAATWLARLLAEHRLPRKTAFDLALLAFLASATLAAAIGYNQDSAWARAAEWSAYHTPLNWSWGKLTFIASAIGLFYALAECDAPVLRSWLARLYPCFGAAVAVYFVLTNDWLLYPAKLAPANALALAIAAGISDLPLHHLMPNVAAGLVAMTVPFLLPAVASTAPRFRWLWVLPVVMAVAGLLFASSRGAVAGLIAAALVMSLACRAPRVSGLLLLAVLAAIALLLIASRVSGPLTTAAGSRPELLEGSWRLARGYLFTGGGLGSFPMLYSTYDLLITVLYQPHSHNLLLDILLEQGVLGLLAFCWLLLVALGIAGHRLAPAASAIGHLGATPPSTAVSPCGTPGLVEPRLLVLAALGSLVVMLVHGQVDDVPYGSRALILLLVPFGWLATGAPELMPSWRRQLTCLAAGLLLLVPLVAWQSQRVAAAWHANLGALEQAQLELSAYRWPVDVAPEIRARLDVRGLRARFQQALSLDPEQPTALLRLAMIDLAQHQPGEARDRLLVLTRVDPRNETAWRLLADSYAALGDTAQACSIERQSTAAGRTGAWRFAEPRCT
jgi:hypothetical protein